MQPGNQNSREKRNVLVAVAGQTPAVITETLWALEQHLGLKIAEIRVITTALGRRTVLDVLFGEREIFARYCRDFKVPHGRIAFSPNHLYVLRDASGSELEDIRDTSDNTSAANQIFSLIRAWTSREDEVLFCSVAGGRKTLGIYLAMALMLCGRPEDSLSHVLVHPELESSVTDFFYPPPEATSFERSGGIAHSSGQTSVPEPFEAAKVELAEIPFPRLREALGGGLPLEKGLLEAVRHSQLVLAYLQDPPTLRLTSENGLVEVGRFSYHLTRQLLAVYAFFLHEFNGPQAAGTIEAVYERRSALAELERRIDRLRLGEREVYAWEKMRDTGELRAQLGPCISKVNRAITSALGDNTLAARYRISTGRRYGVHIERFEIRDSAGKKQPAGGR